MESSLYTIFHNSNIYLEYIGETRKKPFVASSTTLIYIYCRGDMECSLQAYRISHHSKSPADVEGTRKVPSLSFTINLINVIARFGAL